MSSCLKGIAYTDITKSPIHTLLERVESPGLQAKLYLADDPALVTLYEHLRGQTLQTLRGASKVSLKLEWDFVIHTARLYDRMSCDLLALDLGESLTLSASCSHGPCSPLFHLFSPHRHRTLPSPPPPPY